MKKSSLLFCLLFIVLSFFVAQKTLAGVNDNVSGFAWSDSVGWVSFNCTDIPNCTYDYGVKVDPLTGLFSGYAWSENLGWIYFSPVGPYPDLPNYSACLDLPGSVQNCDGTGDYKASGWAKILSNEGWVSFSGVAQDGSSYGVSWNNTNQELNGMAWSSDDLGWLSFNCSNPGEDCGTSNHRVVARLDNAPPVLSSRNPNSRDWGKTDVSVAITYTDNMSGIAYTRHCWTTGASCDPGTIDANTGVVAKDTTGQWTLCVRARDGVGNWSNTSCSGIGVYKIDKQIPTTQIQSENPSGLWQKSQFTIDTLDEDLDSGGINNCGYKVLSYERDNTEHSTGWLARSCNESQLQIGVGSGNACGYESANISDFSCYVYLRAFDLVGNKGEIYKEYHIDWTKPQTRKLYVAPIETNQIYPIQAKEGVPLTLKVEVPDNIKLAGCSLYIDNIKQGDMTLSPAGCSTNCSASTAFNFSGSGTFHNNYASCRDAAGNIYPETQSEKNAIKVDIVVEANNAPQITSIPSYTTSSCSSPTTQTNCNVNFSVSATDADNDILTYSWNFGDDSNSNEQNPSHHYSVPGDYSVKVVVSDGRGGEAESSPIAVHVDEANLFVNLTANPNSGVYPLNGVDLTAFVSGNMFGTINYKFDCTNDGIWDFQADGQAIETYTSADLCNYSSAGTYTAKTFIERGTGSAQNTVDINVETNFSPQAAISVTDYSSCGPGADANTAYTGCNFTLKNVSTDPNGQSDIGNSIWTISGQMQESSNCLNVSRNPICNWTLPANFSAGNYSAQLDVEDLSGVHSVANKEFTVKQDIIAGFVCSADNVNWVNCEDSTFRPLQGSRVYFLDQSEKSEGSTGIVKRTWTKDNAPFSSANDSNPSDIIQGTIIELTVEDGAGRIDSQSYNIQTQLSIPEWQEISPF